MMNKILLTEDQGIIVTGMKILLQAEMPANELDIAKNIPELLMKLTDERYDLVIIDLQLGNGTILYTLIDLLTLYRELRVLVFSGHSFEKVAPVLYNYGVKGYLEKAADDSEIILAIKTVLDGEIYISRHMQNIFLAADNSEKEQLPELLTASEMKILQLLLRGKKSGEISGELNLQPSTVSNAKKKILKKLKVDNLMQLNHIMTPKNHWQNLRPDDE